MATLPAPVAQLGSWRRGTRRHLGVLGWLRAALLSSLVVLAACAEGPGAADEGQAARHVPALHPAIDDLDETVVTIDSGGERFEVVAKVAETAAERSRGLMEVPALPDGVGLLFLFDADRAGGFWMWNTLIDLDIAFIGADGEAHTLATMVPSEAERSVDCPVTTPEEHYRAALEVPGGWLDRVGVAPGADVRWTDPEPVVDG